MRPARAGALVALLLASAAGRASAYFWSESSTKATYVLRYGVCLSANTTHTFETNNLSTGADTVMHLISGTSGAEVAWNDDATQGTLRSKIIFQVPASPPACSGGVNYTVLVRAAGNGSGGSGGHVYNLYWNNVNRGQYPLGGYIVQATVPSNHTMETVLVNNGARATMLYRLEHDGSHYKFAGLDQSSGVGVASKMSGSTAQLQLWVIGLPTISTTGGPIRLVQNDVLTADDDGDGLGNFLEGSVCTCTWETTPICGFDCSTVKTTEDTDGDGLRDDWEVIGVDDASNPQLLPLWGAKATHKDIFVEIDRRGWVTPVHNPVDESVANFAASLYSGLGSMNNPDGFAGVAVHFDTGGVCDDDGGTDGITNICGDMGGSNLITTGPEPGLACYTVSTSNFTTIRADKFHWMVTGGNSSSGYLGARSCIDRNSGAMIAHELGHLLDLFHWGVTSAGRTNAKPHYPSLMNYAYDYAINGSATAIHFSDGARSSLDPANLSETTNYSGATTDISFLFAAPFLFSARPGFPRQVDWNRDGEWDASVMAHLISEPNETNAGGQDHPLGVGNADLDAPDTEASPGAIEWVRWNDVLMDDRPARYVAVNAASDQHFRLGWTTSTSLATWLSWTDIGGAFVSSGGPALGVFPVLGLEALFVFGVWDSPRELRYSTLDSEGNQSAWTSIGFPSGVTMTEVSVARVGTRLYVAGRDSTSSGETGLYFGYLNSSLAWSGWQQVATASGSILSEYGPGIAGGPDGRLYMVLVAASGTARQFDLDLFSLVPPGSTWVQKPTDATFWKGTAATQCPPKGRPGILFRAHRKSDTDGHAPLTSGNGALWVWYVGQGGNCYSPYNSRNVFYRWTENKFNATTQTFTMGPWYKGVLGSAPGTPCYSGPSGGTSVAVAETDRALRAYLIQLGSDNWDTPRTSCTTEKKVYMVPFADGTATPAVTLADYDDRITIRDNTCYSITRQIACTSRCDLGWSATCSGSPPVDDPVECGTPP